MTSSNTTSLEMEHAGNLPHIASRLLNTPLMLSRPKMEVILSVLGPRLNLNVPTVKSATFSSPDGMRDYCVLPGGIAVIPIMGTLIQRGSWVDAASGLTSYGMIQDRFMAAMNDSDVSRILLEVDSPGGEIHGLFDLADMIFNARGDKPITAMINEQCFSAAYLLASAADQIIIPRTGGTGSNGVIAAHVDWSKANDMAGLKVTTVFAGARKNDFSTDEPLTDEALQVLRDLVDETHALQVETIARNRGVSVQSVKDQQAGMFYGKSATKSVLADKVQSFNDTLAEMTKQATTNKGAPRMANEKPTTLLQAPEPGAAEPTADAPAAADDKATSQSAAGDPPAGAAPIGDAPGSGAPVSDPPAAAGEQGAQASAQVIDITERLASARSEGEASARAVAKEITDMCKLMGVAHLAGDMIASGKTTEQARAAIFDEKARVSERSLVTGYHTEQADQGAKATSWASAFAKVNPTRPK